MVQWWHDWLHELIELRWKYEDTEEWTNGGMDGWSHGWLQEWMCGRIGAWRSGWMDGAWMDGRMDGWNPLSHQSSLPYDTYFIDQEAIVLAIYTTSSHILNMCTSTAEPVHRISTLWKKRRSVLAVQTLSSTWWLYSFNLVVWSISDLRHTMDAAHCCNLVAAISLQSVRRYLAAWYLSELGRSAT